MPTDREILRSVNDELDQMGRAGMSYEEVAQDSAEGIADMRVLAEHAQKRAEQLVKKSAARGEKWDFAKVVTSLMGVWIEGFMVGYRFAKKRIEG